MQTKHKKQKQIYALHKQKQIKTTKCIFVNKVNKSLKIIV